ncbi:MAG: DUF1801 domain-containing protein [Armatimonadetes bacterium]|nr:DUF1801 domain-containing protein [Armatimonadota bacterium]
MTSQAKTVDEYLASLPADRREAVGAVRGVILKNLPKGYEEGMLYGMIGYFVPHSILPQGYHCDPKQPLMYASLASQKNHMAVYLMGVYGSAEVRDWLTQEWAKAGKKLDMGKACLRFKRLDDLALDVLGAAIAKVPVDRYVTAYLETLASSKSGKKR